MIYILADIGSLHPAAQTALCIAAPLAIAWVLVTAFKYM